MGEKVTAGLKKCVSSLQPQPLDQFNNDPCNDSENQIILSYNWSSTRPWIAYLLLTMLLGPSQAGRSNNDNDQGLDAVQHFNQRCSKFQIPSTTVETYVLPVPAWNTIETSGDHHHDNIIHTNNNNDNTNRITSYLLKSRNKRRLADVLMIDALAFEFLLKMAIWDWVLLMECGETGGSVKPNFYVTVRKSNHDKAFKFAWLV